MWGFFKRKKSVELSKEERIGIYVKDKEEVLRKSKELVSDFQFDFEFVSEDLQHVLFLDKLSRKIAYIQLSSPEKEPEIIELKGIYGVGIRYDTQELGIDRDLHYGLKNPYVEESSVQCIEPSKMSTMFLISIYFRLSSDCINKDERVIPFYDKEKSEFSYLEKHEELKEIYEFIVNSLHEDEVETKNEAKIYELKLIIEDKERYRAKEDKRKSKIEDFDRKLLGKLTYELENSIPVFLDFGYSIDIDSYKLELSIKGFRENVIYIGCNFEEIESYDIPEIQNLIVRIIELEIQNHGYKEVKVVPTDSKLDVVEIAADTSVQEQIAREVIEVHPKFYKGAYMSHVYYQETLFIYYDEEYVAYYTKACDIKWDKNSLSVLEYLIGDQVINIALVPSSHKIEYFSVENIEELWNTVVHYTIDNGNYADYSKETLLASKAYEYKNQILSIYNVDRNDNLTSDLIDNIEYAFFIHTGQFVDTIEIIEDPEKSAYQEEDGGNIPRVVANWIKEIEALPHTLFEVFDFRHIDREIYVLMDNKLYVASHMFGSADVAYRLPKEPSMETLTKRSLRIDGSHLLLGEWHYNSYHEEFASSIRKYLTDLDQVQKKQMEPWKQTYAENNTIRTLFERFYQKKLKPLIDVTYLDAIFDDLVDIYDEMETFTQFIMKRKYIEGDKFLVGVFIKERVVEIAITDFSETFNLRNGVPFENISNMTLSDCFQAFHTLDFAMIENHEDVAYFMCFLLKNNKIELDVTYQDLQKKLTDLLMQEGEEQMLKDYESYLLNEDEDCESITIEVIDTMDGYQFEEFVAQLFQDMGYKTEVTSSSGDYGIDVIASRKGLKIGIQAKRYSDKVPNKAVQEVIAGIAFYNLDQGLVITNNYYTKQAQNQAKGTNVLLWDREMLQQKLREVYGNILNLDKSE
ncbi:hypothetical protein COL36_10405 [Bacillus wiedmannii]|uniref:restriction endonuclease n=1 Tax=Bacillus wiedmannii TaxID=1890302 RepID=UPI000BF6C042|nr:restriction endonuclease [Bacillus wiedmannii]PFX61612.1 hypothetical protein COL36_10405 [Bacillus wiedmannii]